jgi:hypothetical protein
VVAAVNARATRARWDAAWAVLVGALDTGAPDQVVMPAKALAGLRREDWDVPAAIDRLTGAVTISRHATQAAARTAAKAGAAR